MDLVSAELSANGSSISVQWTPRLSVTTQCFVQPDKGHGADSAIPPERPRRRLDGSSGHLTHPRLLH